MLAFGSPFRAIKQPVMRNDCFISQKEPTAGEEAAERTMSGEKTRKIRVLPTVLARDETVTKMVRERSEVGDLAAVLTVGEKDPREIRSPQTRREVIEREGASEAEVDEECEVVEEGEAVEALASVAVVEEEAASEGNESSRGEVEVTDRKFSIHSTFSITSLLCRS